MIRAFVALALPEPVRFDLMLVQHGLPLPRAVPPENLHLTLLFLGSLAEPVVEDLDLALGKLRAPAFEVAIAGLGMFGGPKPRAVYAGVADNPGLRHLHGKVRAAAERAGCAPEARRFVPHVTLARLSGRPPDRQRLERAVAGRADYAAPRFVAEDFRLYRSHLGAEAATYQELARYPLD